MDIKQLRYFVEVAKHRSVQNAAAALFVSRQCISKSIQNLERSINHDLFSKREVDLIITWNDQSNSKNIFDTVTVYEPYVAMSKKNPLSGKKSVTAEDLKGLKFVYYSDGYPKNLFMKFFSKEDGTQTTTMYLVVV